MGFSDLFAYIPQKIGKMVPKGDSRAGSLSCCALLISIIFFIFIFYGAIFANASITKDMLISSLIINGARNGYVAWPQITFCPESFTTGNITGASCVEVSHFEKKKKPNTFQLLSTHVHDGRCVSFNYADQVVAGPDPLDQIDLWCALNSTNHGAIAPGGDTFDWPGRVRMFVQKPGSAPAEHCEDCIDGLDGAILEANTTAFVYWQAHVFDSPDTGAVEYRTWSTKLQRPEVFATEVPDDIVVRMGFYSHDVWRYTSPSEMHGEAMALEQFATFCVMCAGLWLASYGFYLCLKTTLILVVLGKDDLDSLEEKNEESKSILG